jgi:hypothetical protein
LIQFAANFWKRITLWVKFLVEMGGLEPPTFAL